MSAPSPPRVSRSGWRQLLSVAPLPAFLFLGGLAVLWLGLHLRAEARASLEWQAVPAEVTTVSIWKTADGPKGRMRERGLIRFRFVLDGVTREGTRFDHEGTEARQIRHLRVGQQVTAYVPADQPWKAVLRRDVPGFSVVLLLFGTFCMGFALWFFLARAGGRA